MTRETIECQWLRSACFEARRPPVRSSRFEVRLGYVRRPKRVDRVSRVTGNGPLTSVPDPTCDGAAEANSAGGQSRVANTASGRIALFVNLR